MKRAIRIRKTKIKGAILNKRNKLTNDTVISKNKKLRSAERTNIISTAKGRRKVLFNKIKKSVRKQPNRRINKLGIFRFNINNSNIFYLDTKLINEYDESAHIAMKQEFTSKQFVYKFKQDWV